MTDHIEFDPGRPALVLLDQRRLPLVCEKLVCRSYADVITAIKGMAVRGAPAIGVSAAFACVLACMEIGEGPGWRNKLKGAIAEIADARPTAVNLSWAVGKMADVLERNPLASHDELCALWLKQAMRMQQDDIAICRKIGEVGQSLLHDGDTVLTHCNAGALATAGYGTALAPIRRAVETGKKIRVIADETRPLLQGARLTAWELAQDHIDVSVACDNACATLMARSMVRIVITGADRIAANGDVANKTGTCGVAIMARYYGVPFYIAAPLSTIDMNTKSGADIIIEQRPEKEVSHIGDCQIMPSGVHAWNFAFDVTPAELITGIITEAGILRPPYGQALDRLMHGQEAGA